MFVFSSQISRLVDDIQRLESTIATLKETTAAQVMNVLLA